jgi:hypothetical protein
MRDKKENRIQVRIDTERKDFLQDYAARKKITVTQMFIDFIDWLRRRDALDRSE